MLLRLHVHHFEVHNMYQCNMHGRRIKNSFMNVKNIAYPVVLLHYGPLNFSPLDLLEIQFLSLSRIAMDRFHFSTAPGYLSSHIMVLLNVTPNNFHLFTFETHFAHYFNLRTNRKLIKM